MTFAPHPPGRLRGWNRIRAILFCVLMTFLALVWLRMHNMGQGTTLHRVLGFAPLVGVVILFLFVVAVDWTLKRRGPYKA
jgi:hypothetical protein